MAKRPKFDKVKWRDPKNYEIIFSQPNGHNRYINKNYSDILENLFYVCYLVKVSVGKRKLAV